MDLFLQMWSPQPDSFKRMLGRFQKIILEIRYLRRAPEGEDPQAHNGICHPATISVVL